MAKKRIAVVAGDGIGKEVIPAAISVVEATGAAVEFTHFDWSADRYLKDGVTVPTGTFAMLARDFDAIFVGALGDPRVPSNIHAKEILLGMRFRMDLYANLRPVKLLDESLCPLKNVKPEHVDFVVERARDSLYRAMVERARVLSRARLARVFREPAGPERDRVANPMARRRPSTGLQRDIPPDVSVVRDWRVSAGPRAHRSR